MQTKNHATASLQHRFYKKLCFLLILGAMVAATFTACTPVPVQPSDVSSSAPAESSSSMDVEDYLPEAPPYGEPKAPSKEIADKLAQTFKVGKTYAWLTVPNTTVDNAVMYSPENNDVYLNKRVDYDGNWNESGLIFADFRDKLGDRTELSRNTVVYGHNIATSGSNNGSRFSQLLKYADLDFAKQNQFITFSTPDDEMVWQVFATFYTDVNFYYAEPNPTDDELMYIVSEAGQRTENFFDVDVSPQDKILTLSTCTYKYGRWNTDQRFVVMAKLLAPDSTPSPAEVIKNETPKQPSFDKD